MNGKEDKAKKRKAKSRVCPAPTSQEDDLFELEEKKLRNNKFVSIYSQTYWS